MILGDLDLARFSARSILAVSWVDDTDLDTREVWAELDPHGDVERWPEALRYPARGDEIILGLGGRAYVPEPEEWAAFTDEWRGCIAAIRASILTPSEALLLDAAVDANEDTDRFRNLVQCAGVPAISTRGDWTC